MASESLKALMLVATLRSKGGSSAMAGQRSRTAWTGSSECLLSVDRVNEVLCPMDIGG